MNTRSKCHLLRIFVVTISSWLTGLHTAFPQDYLFDTEIINVEDGLPNRMTYSIVQDKEGFIWVSTLGAISRYDGYSFKTYNASFLNITGADAPLLAIDAGNRLWYCATDIRSNSGVIDIAKDSVYTMESISRGLFTSKDVIYIRNSGLNNDDILIVTKAGLIYKYDGSFEEIYRLSYPVSKPFIRCKANPDGSYWIVHGENIFKVKNKKAVKTINTGMRIPYIVSSWPELILSAPGSVANKYWRLENDSLAPFTIAPHAPEEIEALLWLHKDYNCYVTRDALLIRDTKGKLLYRYNALYSPGGPLKLSFNDAMTDRQNILWVTTENGILKLTAKQNPFEILLPGYSTRGIFKDGKDLWIGAVTNNPLPEGFKAEQNYLDDASINNAMSFYKDLRGHLWIGTRLKKIVEYNPAKDTYNHYRYDYKADRTAFLLPFQNPVTKNYWIGSDNGLFRLDITTKKTTPFPLPIVSEGLHIRQAYQNTKEIWLITNKGIFLMDAQKEVILKHYTIADGLPSNDMMHIHEDDEGIFWLGTKDVGLVRWDLATNSFRQYTRENELSHNKIYAVYEDDDQTLWLPSDYGLMAFDKNTATTRVYLPKNGIAHEEFNYFSHFQDTDGTLYFGGLDGITRFHPKALRKDSEMAAPLYVTQVRVLKKAAEVFTEETQAYKANGKIVLDPGNKILELDLTLLDYERSGENRYAYKLSRKQDQWVYTRENKLSIINPPYGKYDLVIKARGASGQWSENLLIVPMHVQRPFYLRWWFILAVALSGVLIIIVAVRWRIRKLEKDRTRLEAEVQKRTRKIEEQAGKLKALDKAKSRFFANITHEFRTPLTLVAGPVEQIIAEQPPAAIKKRLNGVLKNARNLMGLINQLLDLSKLEGGRMKLEIAHGDIVRYTKDLVQRFQPLADKKHLQLEFRADTDILEIHIDIDKWTKIVHNLLSNAIKFTVEGGSIRVALKQWEQESVEYVQLKVKDTGIGIPAENLKHIFDRFYQTDASSTRLQGGTGIGLSLVKELVELQSGTISVESATGKGSEFTVTLPLTPTADPENTNSLPAPNAMLLPVDHEETQAENSSLPGHDNTGEEKREKLELLIIEDHDGMRDYIRSCIDASLYNISEAANGEEGIEKALETVPDLIISDVMMPKKNGFEVTEAIRMHLATSHIPLILLTAKASLESRLEGLKRGADAYLTKPFSPEELVVRIKKLIELRRLLQKRYQSQDKLPDNNEVFQKEDSFVSELRSYITENISNPGLGSEAVTAHFAVSRTQLYRKLKALANTTIGDYIRSVRLNRAVQLLKEKQLNVSEIAYETGFSSPENFSKAFKKAYGKNPSKW